MLYLLESDLNYQMNLLMFGHARRYNLINKKTQKMKY